jgi:two-component system, cell cycle response regulator
MKILVLSNDEMERTVIRQVVQHNGHEVLNAVDSEEALQTLRESGARFVIVDRSTTDAEEKQFIQRLRNARPPRHIYVLLIASKSQDVDITAPRSGADDYLHKPIVPLELKSRVHIGQRMLGLGDNLVNARDALEKSAMFDPLTKTLNETAFLALSRADLERARRAQAPLSLIALEVVNFKDIFEKHGQEIVNDVLVLIAQMVREKSRLYDSLGRQGDKIFLIPLPGVIGQDAEKIANRIAKGIASTSISLLDGTAVDIKLSIGIVSSMRITAATEIESMIEKAREAAARSLQNGDGQIHTIFV